MLITQVKKQGNEYFVELPFAQKFSVTQGLEFHVHYLEDGTISLSPVLEDPFNKADRGEYYQPDVWE